MILVLGGVAASLLVIIPIFTGDSQNAGSGESGKNLKRIITFDRYALQTERGPTFQYVKISSSEDGQVEEMAVNSKMWFLNPFGRSMQLYEEQNINSTTTKEEMEAFIDDADAHEYYQIVRLPEWLGGTADELSAYRAFSSLDISSHCLVSYWPNEGRMDIQDPCHSNRYRPWDGLAYMGISSFGSSGGSAILFTSNYLALPQIKLAIDSEGYLAAYKPDNGLYSDGVVGEGKRLSQGDLKRSNEKLVEMVVKAETIKVPAEILPGYDLIWISPAGIRSELDRSFESLAGAEHSIPIVAAYRQRASQQFYDYTFTVLIHSNTFDGALTGGKDEYGAKAEQIFNKIFGPFECYEPQKCTYETRSVDEDDGKYALIKTQHVFDPTRDDSYKDASYGRALVWLNGSSQHDSTKQYLIALDATNENMTSIIQAIKAIESG
jgi:hypothetical protein